MLIKEVEKLLQMTPYSLRYYERMGLINPGRDENGYRNYSEKDIQRLKRIRFSRELEIPVENIGAILDDSTSFQTVLEEHINKLSSKINSLQYVREVCEELKEKEIPLLDAMVDEKILIAEEINNHQMIQGLKKVMNYFKPAKTAVIGARVSPREYTKGIFVISVFAVFIGFCLNIGIPGIIKYFNSVMKVSKNKFILPNIESTYTSCILITMLVFVFLLILLSKRCARQEYIEFTDNYIYICSERFQNKISILLGMLLKNAKVRNKSYTYDDLKKVRIELIFSTTSGGYSGLWNIYVPKFTFEFTDGDEYSIDSGLMFGESIKNCYLILIQKGIRIEADDKIIGYFKQDELSEFEYFENIYHLNSK